jgi:hypothetical protein
MTSWARSRPVPVLCAVLALACGERGVDWSAPENLVLREEHEDREGYAELRYWSLTDTPCGPVFDALVDVEHYADFIPGVERVQLLAETPTSKTVQIAQHVIGRQGNAKVEWTFDRRDRTLQFKTLQSDLTYNDGFYDFEESPDGKRCLVKTRFLVRQPQGLTPSAVAQATREGYLRAARAVRTRAGGAPPAG